MRGQLLNRTALCVLLAGAAAAAVACKAKRAPGLDQGTPGGAAGAGGAVDEGGGAGPTAPGGGGAVTSGGGAGPSGGGAGGAAGEPSEGGVAGTAAGGGAGAPPATGGGPITTEAECGNGVAERGEFCDGDDLGAWDCAEAGFAVGELVCNEDCTLDVSGCSGAEQCTDGRDNDGDQTVDCGDDECTEACADACAAPVELPDPSDVTGLTDGHAALEDSANRWGTGEAGGAVVYRVVAANTGVLTAGLSTTDALGVSIRTDCADSATELQRGYGTGIEVSVTEGDVLFVVVDGLFEGAEGSFLLSVRSHPIVCGDANRDGEEGCDDGNTRDGDGCSADCTVESTEGADNDTMDGADRAVGEYVGTIDSAADEDWLEVEVLSPKTSLVARTLDFGDGACALNELDSVLELYDAGAVLLARDDDGGAGYCSDLRVRDLTIGTYYLRVLPSPTGSLGAFPYVLELDLDVCGNGRVSDAEECDDGNGDDTDGCDSDCRIQ